MSNQLLLQLLERIKSLDECQLIQGEELQKLREEFNEFKKKQSKINSGRGKRVDRNTENMDV